MRKAQLGQFMTPPAIADFMANLFPHPLQKHVRLLDAGAGQGALSFAFMEQWASKIAGSCEAHLYEFDDDTIIRLRKKLASWPDDLRVKTQISAGDFIEMAATMIRLQRGPRFTHAILNPPYKKISSNSHHRRLLSSIGLETVNLYSAFVGLSLDLMESGGQLVAIIPRSFCNGPYYKPFRAFITKRAAIRHIHLFGSRDKAFKDDAVLQENVIIRLERGGKQGNVVVSTSTDDSFLDYQELSHSFKRIVFPSDPESFIHVPTSGEITFLECSPSFQNCLADIGVNISTGPVVDFRLRDELRAMPEKNTVPLLYSNHFTSAGLDWPNPESKKPNAIVFSDETEKWFYPNGFYTVVRRFSSKEEKRRIVANVVDPATLPAQVLGFENHLNVFHENRQPLSELLARGLAVYLNCTAVDQFFRRFNGHTQVNAMDLKLMKYPSRDALIKLGEWAKYQPAILDQEIIDQKVVGLA
ncbi:MAG: Eco57I restriction-modification methylase domain-containing protein [Alphaproteobacteria bacterium]